MIPQTKEQVEEMEKAGFPLCLSKGDWEGDYDRHCDTCIKIYESNKTPTNN